MSSKIIKDIDLVFSGYTQNPDQLFNLLNIYLEHKLGKIILMDESAKLVDGTTRELLFRYSEFYEFSILHEIINNTKREIKHTFDEAIEVNRKTGEYEFLYHSKIGQNYIVNGKLFQEISNQILHDSMRKEYMTQITRETNNDDISWEDSTYCMKVVTNLSKSRRADLERAITKWREFVRLDDMIKYALDWMALKKLDRYEYSKFLVNRSELNKIARKYKTIGDFLDYAKNNIEKYAEISYLKDERKFDRFLRGVFKRANPQD